MTGDTFPLGEVIASPSQRETVDWTRRPTYRTMGVLMARQGLSLRRRFAGGDSSTRQWTCSRDRASVVTATSTGSACRRRASTVVPAELDGAPSRRVPDIPAYPKLDADGCGRLLPAHRDFQGQRLARDRCRAGQAPSGASAGRSQSDFDACIHPVPPLPVQERIVEIIGAVDDQITALDAEAGALEGVSRAATSLLWHTTEGDERRVPAPRRRDAPGCRGESPMDAGATY